MKPVNSQVYMPDMPSSQTLVFPTAFRDKRFELVEMAAILQPPKKDGKIPCKNHSCFKKLFTLTLHRYNELETSQSAPEIPDSFKPPSQEFPLQTPTSEFIVPSAVQLKELNNHKGSETMPY